MDKLYERLSLTNVEKTCEGESGMCDSLKTSLVEYVLLMHQETDT